MTYILSLGPLIMALLFRGAVSLSIAFTECAEYQKDLVNDMIRDAYTLSKTVLQEFKPKPPPEAWSFIERKADDPLIPDLFGSISREDWTHIDDAIVAVNGFLEKRNPKEDLQKFIRLACNIPQDVRNEGGQKACADGGEMETIVGQGGNPGRHLIVICPDFWNAINEKEPYWFYSLTKLPKDDICDMKPIELGSQFAARLFYHELFHILPTFNEPLFVDADYKDRSQYGIDNDPKHTTERLLTMAEHTLYSKQNPDTFSFYAILAWRRKTCKWPRAIWTNADIFKKLPFVTIKTFTTTGIPVDGIYGDGVDECPGSNIFRYNPVVTKPVIDTFKNPAGKKQDVLWCRLMDQINGKCASGWVREQFEVLAAKRGRGGNVWQKLWGCFKDIGANNEEKKEEKKGKDEL